ncbi:Cell division protein FtsI/penicillin-binding protein 2 [Corynebacterium glucuronolyticum]|nr:Beta-lactam-inducible penicillin-binding protein [Corynebacterium glucuronolyticum DSM 44120]SMB86127.1 Cell division protein FtsI/penicillin-binding protein 2 [Corynebacterium glucuronolyticum]
MLSSQRPPSAPGGGESFEGTGALHWGDMKRRIIAACTIAVLTATGLTACTPKPKTANPVVEEFAQALSEENYEAAAALTDDPESALSEFEQSASGLQAEGVDTAVTGVDNGDTLATGHVKMTWDLPRDREFTYAGTLNLNKVNNSWVIRWNPNVIHPSLGSNQHLELRAIEAQRASVVTQDGVEILKPGVKHRIIVDKQETTSLPGTVTKISQVLSENGEPPIDIPGVSRAIAETDGVYSVATVSSEHGDAVKKGLDGVSGVTVNDESALVRPQPEFAPELVSAIEKEVTEKVEGENGWKVVTANNDGAVIDTLTTTQPQLQAAIPVSLDHKVQEAAQIAVDRRPEMKVMLVAMRPSDGAILGIAQTRKADEDGNVALMGMYPPGSVFKIITAMTGLNSQGLTPGSTVPCPGTMELGTRVVTNYNSFSRGMTSLTDAFASSCNTTFADISYRLAPGELHAMGQRFGLGVDYEIPGLSTVTGSVPEGEEPLDRIDAGYGQGDDLVSPFGMALVASTAAHGSTPVPWLIDGLKTEVKNPAEPPAPEQIAQLQSMMRAVVTQGTARGMRAGGEIHAKTGEAEFAGGSHAWFAGYRDDLAFATLIVGGGGSESATAVTDVFFTELDRP